MQQQTGTAVSPAAQLSPAELVQSLFSAFLRGDIAYIVSHVTDDCRWVVAGKGFVPIGGEYTGPKGVARFFQILSETEDITRFEPREFFEKGDDVVVLGSEETRVLKTGKVVATDWAMVFRTRDGLVSEWQHCYDSAVYAKAHEVDK